MRHVPPLEQLVSKYHPNLIIVGSGDTMAGYAQPALPGGVRSASRSPP